MPQSRARPSRHRGLWLTTLTFALSALPVHAASSGWVQAWPIVAVVAVVLLIVLGGRYRHVRAQQAELDRLFSLSLDMLCVVGEDLYFKRVNPAFTRILGHSAEELTTRPIADFVHPDDREATAKRLRRLARGEKAGDIENRYRCSDGSYRWLAWRSVAVPRLGVVYGIARDVTEKKKAEEAVDRANEARGEFLRNMSHEIRTPMNAIIGLSNLLLKGNLPAEERGWAESVQVSANNLLRVIDDILDFSKIEAGKMVVEKDGFRLREALDSVVQLLQPRAESQDIELRLEVSHRVPDALISDSTRLRQVLLNLVGNAIKFTEEGYVALIVDLVSPPGAVVHVRFEVRDTGIGIDPEAKRLLFDPFTQVDSSTTRQFGGTGLGLAISQRIVSLLGGQIEVESAPGEGSVFRFTLPFDPWIDKKDRPTDKVAASESTTASPRLRRSQRILVAEDDEINCFVVTRVLGFLGYQADLATNGLETLDAVERKRYDLVLMDCQMPELDGYEATRRIRRREQASGKHLPIIAMTAHAMKGERERCLNAGMDDYISKPFTEEGLAAILDRWLGSEDKKVVESPMVKDKPRLRTRTIEIFLEHGPRKLEAMRRALSQDNLEDLAAAAHSLTGNAGFMGADHLAELCGNLEDQARSGDASDCRDHLQEIEREYERTVAKLEGLVGN